MKINKDDKVVDALYQENKMLRDKMNKQRDTLYSFIDETIPRFNNNVSSLDKGVYLALKGIKEFCEKNIWNE